MLDAVSIVVTLFIVMAVGYFLSYRKLIDDKVATFISKLIVNFGVPSTAIVNMVAHFTRNTIGAALSSSLIAFLTILIGYVIGGLIATLFRVDRKRRGLFAGMIACANTMFIGLPVCQALYGDNASYVLVYDIAHSFLFWTLGIFLMTIDGDEQNSFSAKNLLKIFSPGFIGLIVSVLLIVLGIQLPVFLEKTLSYFGSLCTPLALIYCGYVLQKSGLRSIRFEKDMVLVLLGRAVITPLLFIAACKIFGLGPEISRAFVTTAAMPVMNNAPIMAKVYGSDYVFGTQCLTVSMIVCLLMIPLWSMMLNMIF
ncbi:MAG: AEC family transporter [Clostridia bacterium]|nr:AEC family transporter [Clostridia bacterium]